jgi:hypothetical protein
MLTVLGEQDSAKTVLSKLLRTLIDPNTASVRALALKQCELSIAATTATFWPSTILSWGCVPIPDEAARRSGMMAARLALRHALPARQRRQFSRCGGSIRTTRRC